MILVGAFFRPDGSVDRQHMGDVPNRSRFQAGDWVRLHGYRGCIGGPQFWGLRGVVLGGMGNHLRGLTDDGREWSYPAASLVRDGEPDRSDQWCLCCPHPERFRPRRVRQEPAPRTVGPVPECLRPYLPAAPVESVQLDLFEVAA